MSTQTRTKTTLHVELPDGLFAKLCTSAGHKFAAVGLDGEGNWMVLKWTAHREDAGDVAAQSAGSFRDVRVLPVITSEQKYAILEARARHHRIEAAAQTTIHAELPGGAWVQTTTSAGHQFAVIVQGGTGAWSVLRWVATSVDARRLAGRQSVPAAICPALSDAEKAAIVRLRAGDATLDETAAELVALQQPAVPDAVPAGPTARKRSRPLPKASRNATVPNPSPPAADERAPRTVVTLALTNKRSGVIEGPGWTGALRYSSQKGDWNYYAETFDAQGNVLYSVRNSWHKERAVRELAMLMGVTGRITVAIEL